MHKNTKYACIFINMHKILLNMHKMVLLQMVPHTLSRNEFLLIPEDVASCILERGCGTWSFPTQAANGLPKYFAC